MLKVYGNTIQRADQTDGYFIMSSIRKKKERQKRERTKVKESKEGKNGWRRSLPHRCFL